MTNEALNVLRAQMAATISVANPGWTTAGVINEVDALIAALGITDDEPAPAEPAKTEPDYRALLRDLVRAIQQESVNTYQWDSHNLARLDAAVAAVRP